MLLTDTNHRFLAREVGAQIRAARQAKGWKRADLRKAYAAYLETAQAAASREAEPGLDESDEDSLPSLQALQTWELGTRNLTLPRLLQVCAVLEVSMLDLLSEALRVVTPPDGALKIDQRKLAATGPDELVPLKRWIEVTDRRRSVESLARTHDVVVVPPTAFASLATLLGCHQSELPRALTAVVLDRS